MGRNRWRFSKPSIAIVVFGLAVGLLAGLTVLITRKPATGRRMALVDDWSTHHLIFSNPGTVADALAYGRFEQWYRTINDPRFQMQQMKRSQHLATGAIAAQSPLHESLSALAFLVRGPGAGGFLELIRRPPLPKRPLPKPKGDWSYYLGSTSGAAVNATMYPAKYTFDVTKAPDCTNDFAVFAINQAGSSSQPTIVAFNNLYSGTSPAGLCGSAPTVLWAYNAATTPVMTSPILSPDGTMVAFVEKGSSGAVLHVLRPESGEGASSGGYATSIAAPTTIVPSTSPTAAADWANCLAGATSCMFNLTYTSNSNSNSSPFYNYTLGADTLYVGDDAAFLWKITGVFNGTPALATGNWANGIRCHSYTFDPEMLTGPVWDPASNNIFVGDWIGHLWYVMDTDSTTGSCSSIDSMSVPPCLGTPAVDATNGQSSNYPIKDPPLVDSASQKVFVFDSGTNGGTAYVTQTNTALGSVVATGIGTGSGGNKIHDGDFDNSYYKGSYTSGHLYACGNPYGDPNGNSQPELFSITFDSTGTMISPSTEGPNLGTSAYTNPQECSPLTEIYNTGTSTDWLFLGVNVNCPNSMSGGCVEAWDITSGPPTSGASPTNQSSENGGTSGIVVDNVSSEAQASSLYFSTLGTATCGTPGGGNTGCAVKVTQSGLQ